MMCLRTSTEDEFYPFIEKREKKWKSRSISGKAQKAGLFCKNQKKQ
jgi:hypothetical protein